MRKSIIVVLIITLLILFVTGCAKKGVNLNELSISAASGTKNALDPISAAFTEQTGVKINIQYLCSAMVLSSVILTEEVDLFLPANRWFLDKAKDAKIVDESTVYAGIFMYPVIVTPKGNPKKIAKLEDLAKPGVQVALGDFENLSVGRVSYGILVSANLLDAVVANQVHTAVSSSKLQAVIALGHADAAINWYPDWLLWKDKSEMIKIEKNHMKYSMAPIVNLNYSKRKEIAIKFIDFMKSDAAKKILQDTGYILPEEFKDCEEVY